MRKQEGCIWILYLLTIYLKCKTFEIILIEFVLLCLFYNCIILFLHIESLYKVGQRYLFRQVLTPFIELITYAYWLGTR